MRLMTVINLRLEPRASSQRHENTGDSVPGDAEHRCIYRVYPGWYSGVYASLLLGVPGWCTGLYASLPTRVVYRAICLPAILTGFKAGFSGLLTS